MGLTSCKKKIIGPGSSNVDLTGFAPRLPIAGETVMGSELHIGPGGKGANQMTAAARLNGDVYFITRIGKDTFGAVLEQHFEAEGFQQSYISHDENTSTGCALIEIEETTAQNRIVVIPAANLCISPTDVLAAESDFMDAGAVLTQLEIPIETVMEAKDLAARYGKPFILNPAPFRPLSPVQLAGIDWLTPNETEASSLTGVEVHSVDTARSAARILLDFGVRNVVITLGVAGAYWTNGLQEAVVPGIPLKAVETTGAGDTFNGALAVAVAEDMPPEVALRFANCAAAISVTRLGAAASAPTREEVEVLMKTIP